MFLIFCMKLCRNKCAKVTHLEPQNILAHPAFLQSGRSDGAIQIG